MGQSHSIDIEINSINNQTNYVGISTLCKYRLTGNNDICLDWKKCKEFIDFMDMIDSQRPYTKGYYLCDIGLEIVNNKEANLILIVKSEDAIDIQQLRQYIHAALDQNLRYKIERSEYDIKQLISRDSQSLLSQITLDDTLYNLKTNLLPVCTFDDNSDVYVYSNDFIEYCRELLYLMSAQESKYITKYIGYTINKEKDEDIVVQASIILEQITSSLSEQIYQNKKKNSPFNFSQLLSIVEHVYAGLKDLQHLKLQHKNLTAKNIFIDNKGQYKIGDIGSTPIIDSNHKFQILTLSQGDIGYSYASPEIQISISNKELNIIQQDINWEEANVYSLAKIILEAALLKYVRNNQSSIQEALGELKEQYGVGFCELLQQALCNDIKSRITLSDFVNQFINLNNQLQNEFQMIDDFVGSFPVEIWEKSLKSLEQHNFRSIIFKMEDDKNCLTKYNLTELVNILKRQNTQLTKFHLSFGTFDIPLEIGQKGNGNWDDILFRDIVQVITNNPTITDLKIEIILSKNLSDDIMCDLAKAIKELTALQKLFLNFWFHQTASDTFCQLLADSLSNLTNLTDFVLILQDNNTITETGFLHIVNSLAIFNGQMKNVYINLLKNKHITENCFIQLFNAINQNTNLKCLGLKINSQQTDLRSFFGKFNKFLEKLETLEILHLSFWNQTELTDADFILLLGSLRNHTKLKSLRLDFSKAINLTDASVITLIVLLQRFKNLESVVIAFSFNQNISEEIIISIMNTLQNDFQTLVSLGLHFLDNPNVTPNTLKQLNKLLLKLENLKYLMVYINSVQHLDKSDFELYKQISSKYRKNDYNLGSLEKDLYLAYSYFEYY